MLLLTRKTNESITCWPHGRMHEPLVIRVAEVTPTDSVTIGFEGESHEICRTEIFHNYHKEDSKNGNIDSSSN
jgi:sRNA-binding carbon storage regulator CsrA